MLPRCVKSPSESGGDRFPLAQACRPFNSPFQDDALKPVSLALAPFWPETAESCHCREKYRGPAVTIFRRLREDKTTALRGRIVRLFVFAFFTPAITPPLAAHRSDTEPTIGSDCENRASVAPFLFSPLSRFPLSLGNEMRFRARLAVSPSVKRAANGRVTDSGFKKKL